MSETCPEPEEPAKSWVEPIPTGTVGDAAFMGQAVADWWQHRNNSLLVPNEPGRPPHTAKDERQVLRATKRIVNNFMRQTDLSDIHHQD